MPSSGVVAGDPPEDCEAGLAVSWPALPALQGLPFQGRVEALRGGVVRACPDRSARTDHAEFATRLREVLRGVLGEFNRSLQQRGKAAPRPGWLPGRRTAKGARTGRRRLPDLG